MEALRFPVGGRRGSNEIATLLGRFRSAFPHRHDHPGDAEAVRHYAEARREERLGERHLYLAARLQGLEQAIRL